MRLKAAFEGKLQEYMKAEFATAERAVTLGGVQHILLEVPSLCRHQGLTTTYSSGLR